MSEPHFEVGAVYDIEIQAPFLGQRPVQRFGVTYLGSRTFYGESTESDDDEGTESLFYEFRTASDDVFDVREHDLVGYVEVENDAS